MGTEFLRLRRKNAVWRGFRALLTGISVALLVAGGLMAMFKLTTTDGQWMLCAIAGAAAGLVTMVVRFLLLRRSDLRAAEQIDSEHNLKERVQTMIAFRDTDSAMLQMQRQDTEDKLKTVKTYGVRKLSVAAHVVAVLLAAAVMVTGVILPARAEPEIPEYVEPDYSATAWQIASLEELIVHVQESNMVQLAKDQTVAELQSLRETLNAPITVSAFKSRVIEVIANTYTYTDRVNSNDDVHDVIHAIDHEVADEISYVVGSLGNLEFNADVEDIGYQLGQDVNLPTVGELADAMDTQLAKIVTDYLADNDYEETDALYRAVLNFASGLHDVADLVESEAEASQISDRLGEVIHGLKSEANLALEQQTVTKEECVYVVKTLCSIFSISPSECPPDPDPVYTKGGEDEDSDEVGGGYGDGEMQYAGDEQVYNYKTNEHVSYTEVVTEYYNAMLQASLEGELSEEMVEFILKYFSQLHTG